ncbi:MAG: Hsp20/alpha crystallin family protein [Candidatus Diapherotrites archaeon]|nr:Hsp20/alpha crystallin family protein [Candidatus Diapherotrites archaeon]
MVEKEKPEKRKIDELIDFENLEQLMDQLMKSFEESEGMKADKAEVFGVSIKISKDGKPIMQELAKNLKPKQELKMREPLVDIRSDSENVFIIAELPGVEKESVDVRLDGLKLSISAESAEPFFKQVALPFQVVEEPEKTSFNNGILELVFKRKQNPKLKGKKIKID